MFFGVNFADGPGICSQCGCWSGERVSKILFVQSLIVRIQLCDKEKALLVHFFPLKDPHFMFRFSTELNSGLLEVISPPASYYPDLTNLKETFGDSKERVR